MSVNPKLKFPKPGKKERSQRYPGLESKMIAKPEFGKDTYKGSGRLAGKVALITGSDSGIGRARSTPSLPFSPSLAKQKK